MLEWSLLADHRLPRATSLSYQSPIQPKKAGQTRGRTGGAIKSSLDLSTGGASAQQFDMEKLKKPLESYVNNNTESKKERSLTSIIDQLLINRSKTNTDQMENSSENSPSSTTENYKASTICESNSGSDNNEGNEAEEASSKRSPRSGPRDKRWETSKAPVESQGAEDQIEEKRSEGTGECGGKDRDEGEGRRERLGPKKRPKRRAEKEAREVEEKELELAVSPAGEKRPDPEDPVAAGLNRSGGQNLVPSEKALPLGSPVEEARAASTGASQRGKTSRVLNHRDDSDFRPSVSASSSSLGRLGGSTPPPRGSRSATGQDSMPTDTLSVASAAPHEPVPVVKSERFSPEIDSSSGSPSVSPHSPSPARGFPSSAVALGAFGLGLRTAPISTSTAGLAAAIPAFPHQSAAGLDRFSPGSINSVNSVCAPASGTPAIKQMEMMTRNYSDFMRSLAAKYNNQNSQENNNSLALCPTNGLNRSLDSGYPFKTSSPRQITGRVSGDDIPSSGRGSKRETQTSPPLLTPQHAPVSPLDHHGSLTSHHRFSPYNLSDFSSSQTLLNLVRTASAQSASQLETYLRGAATGKRPLEGGETRGDPLDLSSKRCRSDFDPLTAAAALHGVSDRLHPAAAGLPFRDLRDLVHHGSLKLDPSELLSGPIADLNAALRLSAKRGGSLSNLLDSRLLANNNHANSKSHEPNATRNASGVSKTNNAKSAEKNNCVSLCNEQSCSSKSDATEVSSWTVVDVVQFINTLDCCSEYAEKFLEQSIDGASLCMLSEEHLTSFLGMKLGPALRLRAAIAKKIGHCATCMHCIHCHGDSHRTPSPLLAAHPRHPSPRPQSSSPGSSSVGHSSSHGHHANKETSRSSPVSK